MAGYSQNPLVKKLGIKPAMQVYVYGAPAEYIDWIHPLPDDITFHDTLVHNLDFIQLFVVDQKVFERTFLNAKKYLKKDGMMWISWPKKSAKVPTDLDENVIREFGLKAGLVDVKVCAVSDVWSGLKFVYRVKDANYFP